MGATTIRFLTVDFPKFAVVNRSIMLAVSHLYNTRMETYYGRRGAFVEALHSLGNVVGAEVLASVCCGRRAGDESGLQSLEEGNARN